MAKGRKRTKAEYESEIEEAAKRMKKYPEHKKSAKNSQEWSDFLIDIGVNEKVVDSEAGSKFWNDVREEIYTRPAERRNIYKEAREAGMPAKLARRIRDWSPQRATEAIENWEARY